MLNRFRTEGPQAFDARHLIAMELRARLADIPRSPLDWSAFEITVSHLAAFERLLCDAAARTAELRALWRESVLTAAFARRLAPRMRGDARLSAIAGLLHRLGDMLTIRAIGEIEYTAHIRLDAASKADLCAVHGGEQLERTVRAWGVPPRAAATAAEWRRLREFPAAAADAAAVYLARLFAIELIAPQFCVPGVVDASIEEVGLDAAALCDIRGDATIKSLLSELQ
jgi:hypothetical protein